MTPDIRPFTSNMSASSGPLELACITGPLVSTMEAESHGFGSAAMPSTTSSLDSKGLQATPTRLKRVIPPPAGGGREANGQEGTGSARCGRERL